MKELQGLLEEVQKQVAQQAQARARQSFLQESQQVLRRADAIQAQLCSEEEVVDVASVQRLLAQHRDLLEEIHLHQERSGQECGQGKLWAGQGLWGRSPGKQRQEVVCHPGDWPKLMLEAGF